MAVLLQHLDISYGGNWYPLLPDQVNLVPADTHIFLSIGILGSIGSEYQARVTAKGVNTSAIVTAEENLVLLAPNFNTGRPADEEWLFEILENGVVAWIASIPIQVGTGGGPGLESKLPYILLGVAIVPAVLGLLLRKR